MISSLSEDPVILANKTLSHEGREQVKDLLAGTMAGVFCKVIEYPFDTLKVRLQTTPEKYGYSALQCYRVMTLQEGHLSIFKGLPAPLFGAMGENSIAFWTYGAAARFIGNGKPKSEMSLSQIGVSGFLAGIAIGTWLTPVEFIKCQMQDMKTSRKYFSALNCLKKTLSEPRGLRKIFTGYWPTLNRETFGNAAWFTTYEAVSKWLTPKSDRQAPAWAVITGGGAAGVAFWSLIYPIDLVKSKIQTQLFTETFWSLFVKELNTGGVRALYRGMGITLPRAAISNGVVFFAYEYSKRFLDSIF